MKTCNGLRDLYRICIKKKEKEKGKKEAIKLIAMDQALIIIKLERESELIND